MATIDAVIDAAERLSKAKYPDEPALRAAYNLYLLGDFMRNMAAPSEALMRATVTFYDAQTEEFYRSRIVIGEPL